jgi:hypothetical protein
VSLSSYIQIISTRVYSLLDQQNDDFAFLLADICMRFESYELVTETLPLKYWDNCVIVNHRVHRVMALSAFCSISIFLLANLVTSRRTQCSVAGKALHHTYPLEYHICSSQPRQKSCWASSLRI